MNEIAATLATLEMTAPVTASVQMPADSKTRATAVRPRLWSVFLVWFTAFVVGNLALAVALGIGIGVTAFLVAEPGDEFATTILPKVQTVLSHPVLALLVTLVPYQLGMLLVTALAVRLSKESARERTGLLPPSGRRIGAVRLTLLAAFTASTAYAVALLFSVLFGAAPAASTADATTWSWWTIPVYGLILTAFPAVIEEIFFRGYIQRRLLQRWSPTVAIGVSTALFAIVHMDSLQHIAAVIPLGAVTGLLAWRTNSIKPGMIVHAIHNAGVVLFGWAAGALGAQMTPENVDLLVVGTLSLLAIAGLPAVIFLMRSRKAEGEEAFASPMAAEFAAVPAKLAA